MKKAFLVITEYLLLFMLAACIGWLYEIGCVYVMFHEYQDRGVLHLPMCPIYGFGLLFLLLVFRNRKNIFLLFFGSAAITTIIELVSSYAIEHFLHESLWTYEDWPLQYQGRISAVSSAMFGLLATLFLRLVRPLVAKLFKGRARMCAAWLTLAAVVFCVVWELRFRV